MSARFALGALCIVATVAVWAGWYIVIRLGLTSSHLDVQDLAAVRFGVAGMLMLPVVWRRGLALDRLGWPGLIAIVVGGGAPFALLVGAGLVYAPVSHATALTQGTVVLKERVTGPAVAGYALIMAGALMIGGISLSEVNSRETPGHLLFIAASVVWAGYTVALRKARLEGLHAPALAAVASLILYLPVYLLLRGERLLAAPFGDIVFQGLYQGVLTAILSLLLYSRGVALIGASAAGAFGALGPVIAALLSIVVLGDRIDLHDWIAIAVITAGVLLASGAVRLQRT